MKDFTTIEHLIDRVSPSYGAVITFGDKVFVSDIDWRDGFYAEIYEFVESPEETGLGEIECRLNLIAKAEEKFKDNGHAIAWCMAQK